MNVEAAYVDTSVLGAYYCPEPMSAEAERALHRIRIPAISALGEVELFSLIARKRRLRELTENQAQAVRDLFDNQLAEGFFQRISLRGEHFVRARQLVSVRAHALRTLDALHLAVAIGASLPILTADQGLARAARRESSPVMLIRSP